MEGYQWEGKGENGGKNIRNKKHKWQVQNRQGEGKNSIGNVEAKELICITHGHEIRRGMRVGAVCRMEGDKGGGEWNNCNSIINKTFLKRKEK